MCYIPTLVDCSIVQFTMREIEGVYADLGSMLQMRLRGTMLEVVTLISLIYHRVALPMEVLLGQFT